MNVYHDDNHEHVQLFDEIVYVQQPWQSTTLSYNLPITDASTPISISANFQNQSPHSNINWLLTNLEMERLHLFSRLEQLHHIDQRSSNQLVYIPHLKHVEPKTTPTIVRQGVTYP
jgi:hypothetical protein